ncbi:hypothetical protein DDI_0327 [Dickeya dianthicola RNS04.9]|uniref:DUF1778 domain-containing protein n=1 Tax=Dickeya dianthicola TaxID=204039 RepID=A0AAW4LI35_9GAMM|nr:hypothetical protein DDI_0327 [Dickeya dianthicola RNS04.9]MBT1426657.1 DUF1778 domain-containing protein [Dickeya dianthicola]MBT1430711.1 DUF1778 domain-containing protein [Dickeya dianthicola]MBT1458180.1 DUF1778 domain-containing protein [Dickeya dianthicola]MBT1489437.1 DUF1778 domain-containing protein [Dickeya dianthicola]
MCTRKKPLCSFGAVSHDVAEDELNEQHTIMAEPDAYQAFLTRLEQPPSPNAALRKTMQTPAPWERKK